MKHTIQTLQDALYRDLTMCHTTHEQIMVKTIGGREIRELAENISRTRRLTPSELRTAMQYGYKG